MNYSIALQPTGYPWDAPIGLYIRPDHGAELRRDDVQPTGWRQSTFIPHGVVLIDGEMSEFDRARQPASEADKFRMLMEQQT